MSSRERNAGTKDRGKKYMPIKGNKENMGVINISNPILHPYKNQLHNLEVCRKDEKERKERRS